MLLLAAAFIVMPFIEIAVILKVGHAVGVLETVGLLILVSAVGGWLVRREGMGVLRRLRASLNSGRIPGTELVDGALVLVAGTLLLTPGFVSDVMAVFMLFPPTRSVLRAAVIRRFRNRVTLYRP